jgi:hypothetical protein
MTARGNEGDEVGGYVGVKVDWGGGGGYVGRIVRFYRIYHIIDAHHLRHVCDWFRDHLGGGRQTVKLICKDADEKMPGLVVKIGLIKGRTIIDIVWQIQTKLTNSALHLK